MDKAFLCNRVCGGEAEASAFDGFEILASPLGGFSSADRERRVFKGPEGRPGGARARAVSTATCLFSWKTGAVAACCCCR
jgi:hypothetical protein